MKKLPSLTEMEHITSKEFGENMDAVSYTHLTLPTKLEV